MKEAAYGSLTERAAGRESDQRERVAVPGKPESL